MCCSLSEPIAFFASFELRAPAGCWYCTILVSVNALSSRLPRRSHPRPPRYLPARLLPHPRRPPRSVFFAAYRMCLNGDQPYRPFLQTSYGRLALILQLHYLAYFGGLQLEHLPSRLCCLHTTALSFQWPFRCLMSDFSTCDAIIYVSVPPFSLWSMPIATATSDATGNAVI